MKKLLLATSLVLFSTANANAVPIAVGTIDDGSTAYVEPTTFVSLPTEIGTIRAIAAYESYGSTITSEYWYYVNCSTNYYRLYDPTNTYMTEEGFIQPNTIGSVYRNYLCR